MSPNRILFLASWLPEPNSPTKGVFVLKHAKALATRRPIQLLYARGQKGLANYRIENKKEGNLDIRIILYPQTIKGLKDNWAFLKAINFGYKSLKNEGITFGLIHANVLFPVGLFAWFLSKRTKVPYIITEHLDLFLRDMLGVEKAPKPGLMLRSFIHRKALFNTVCSKPMLAAFARFNLAKNTEVWPNVVDFGPMPTREFPKVKNGKPALLHISSLREDQKNISGILEALALLTKVRTDFSFHFIGSGADRNKHEKYAADLDLLNNQVFFEGYVSEDEKQAWLERGVAHVMHSHFEGFSVVTAEAIGAGLPVIVSDKGGPTDFVDENNGYLIPTGPTALAEALNQLLDEYQSFDRLKIAQDIRNRFSATEIAHDFQKLLDTYNS